MTILQYVQTENAVAEHCQEISSKRRTTVWHSPF